MPFTHPVPGWNAQGAEPPESLRTNGWQINQKPPADYFNWFFYNTSKAIIELQLKAINTDQKGVANGVATLGSDGKLTAGQVPSIATGNLANNSVTNDKLGTDVKVGSLASLTTTTKGSVTAAVNDVKSLIDAHTGDANIHVTLAEKNTWNNKASTSVATTSANGLMSSVDKIKLNGAQAVSLTDDNGYTTDISGQNINNVKASGFYYGNNLTNSPLPSVFHRLWVMMSSATSGVQLAILNSGSVWTRNLTSGTWEPWKVLGSENNIQCGSVEITPSAANTPTFVTLTFPRAFLNTPSVIVSPGTAFAGTIVTGWGTTAESTTSVRIYVTRTNTTATRINYIATDLGMTFG